MAAGLLVRLVPAWFGSRLGGNQTRFALWELHASRTEPNACRFLIRSISTARFYVSVLGMILKQARVRVGRGGIWTAGVRLFALHGWPQQPHVKKLFYVKQIHGHRRGPNERATQPQAEYLLYWRWRPLGFWKMFAVWWKPSQPNGMTLHAFPVNVPYRFRSNGAFWRFESGRRDAPTWRF